MPSSKRFYWRKLASGISSRRARFEPNKKFIVGSSKIWVLISIKLSQRNERQAALKDIRDRERVKRMHDEVWERLKVSKFKWLSQ